MNNKSHLSKFTFGAVAFLFVLGSLTASGQVYSAGKATSSKSTASSKRSSPAQGGWKKLFNGSDLSGWRHVGKGSMSVDNGQIRGHGGMGLLYYEGQKFGNCTIRVVYRM